MITATVCTGAILTQILVGFYGMVPDSESKWVIRAVYGALIGLLIYWIKQDKEKGPPD